MRILVLIWVTIILLITSGCSKGDPIPESVNNDLYRIERKLDAFKIFQINHNEVEYDEKKKELLIPLKFNEDVELPRKLVGKMATDRLASNENVDKIVVTYQIKNKKYKIYLKKNNNMFKEMR